MLRAVSLLALPLACVLVLPARAPAEEWGTLKGQVIYTGSEKPNEKANLAGHKDQNACLKNGPISKDELVVNKKNKGLRWVVVWLAADNNGNADNTVPLPIHPELKNIKKKSLVMDQPCCKFEPHIITLREGQDFIGKNSSQLVHNMRVIGVGGNEKNTTNMTLPAKTEQKIGKVPWKPALSPSGALLPNPVNCDIHSWMKGWLFVFAHPYFAVTDEDGKFTIEKVPVGKYHVVMWHERDGWALGESGKPADRNGRIATINGNQPLDLGKLEVKDSPKDD
jgi:hypothetical protein